MFHRRSTLFVLAPIGTFLLYLLARLLLPGSLARQVYVENGPVELGTAILFAIAGVLAAAFCRSAPSLPRLWQVAFCLFACLCAVVALEEVSYGQQLFGWRSPEWFESNNHHQQTNLHNLMGNRPSHILKKVGNYGSLVGFVVVPAIAMRLRGTYAPGHWTHYLLPRLELLVVVALAQLSSCLWDAPKSMLGEYWHQGWNEVREFYWAMAACLYVVVLRDRHRNQGSGSDPVIRGPEPVQKAA